MATQDFDWDGEQLPYVPADVTVPDEVELNEDYEQDIDLVSYEVVRHSLWNINREHGNTIENLAVSPITLETRDFQTGIPTENAEFVFFGSYLQYFAGTMDLISNWVMENRGDEPGIEEGDIFLHNDPWVGTPHQPDVALIVPVVHEGEIFCWVSNLMHQNDVSGTVAGSFCPNAEDVYWDPPLFPPRKVVSNGSIIAEKEDVYRRQSRTPRQLSMDLRAGIAGINSSRDRVQSLIDEYGAETVKGTMRQLINSGEHSFKDILSNIPDGTWRERVYQERAITGDDGVYRIELMLRKEGDQLYFDNSGTEEQVGAINQPFADCGAAVVVADIDDEAGSETVERIRKAGGQATVAQTDVSDPDDVATMVDTAVETYGRLDFAFNNTGIRGERHNIENYPRDAWQDVLDVNLTGVWSCVKHELGQLREQDEGGVIVNAASVVGKSGLAEGSSYAAAKHGVIGVTKTAAMEVADRAIRVNAVCPGYIETSMLRSHGDRVSTDEETVRENEALHPMDRLGTPEEIDIAVTWLCSEETSFVTGEAVDVDGGFLAGK